MYCKKNGTWTGQARVHLTKPHFQSNLYPWNWCNFYYCLYLADLQSSSLKLVQFSATIVCIMLLSGMCRLPCCGIFVVVVLGMSLGISLGIGGLGEAENTIFAASFSSKYQGEMIPVLLCVLLCVFYKQQLLFKQFQLLSSTIDRLLYLLFGIHCIISFDTKFKQQVIC